MSAFSHTDWTVICNGTYDDGTACMASGRTDEIDRNDVTTARDVRRILKARGWLVNVPVKDGTGRVRRLDFCPHHNPDLAIRVRAALDDGGWAEFSSRADAGNIILNAPGPEGSWRSLVTEQCADYLNGLGFRTEIINDSLHVSED